MVKKKVVKKKAEEKEDSKSEDLGKEVGRVVNYFDKIGVAVIDLSKVLKVGAKIKMHGMNTGTDFEMEVKSMQVEHKEVEKAKKGDSIGMKTDKPVKRNDKVYLI